MKIITAIILLILVLLILNYFQKDTFRPEATKEASELVKIRNEFISGADTYDKYRKIVKVADVDNYYRTRKIIRNCEKKDNCFNDIVENLN